MKIYTKSGDGGKTGLFAGPRVWKDDVRIEAYGSIDELNGFLGVARNAELAVALEEVLESVQHDLFAIGAELATPDPAAHDMQRIALRHIERLETAIDRFESQLPPLQAFILPSGSTAAARLHVARCVCRRAERRLVSLWRREQGERLQLLVGYLNRLSDLLFVMSRVANQQAGQADVPWKQE